VPDELGDARSVRRRHVHDLLVFVALIWRATKAHKEKPHKENLHNFVPAQPKLKHVQSHFESLWFKAAFCCRMLLRSSLCRPARDKNVTVARDDFTGSPVAAVCHRLQKMVLHSVWSPLFFSRRHTAVTGWPTEVSRATIALSSLGNIHRAAIGNKRQKQTALNHYKHTWPNLNTHFNFGGASTNVSRV
jgi:hypothetical protein